MTVGRICCREVDTAEMTDTAHAAAQRMLQRKVGMLVVVDGDRHPVGILTDRDLALRVIAHNLDHETLVQEIMTAKPQIADEEQPVEDALERMRDGGFRRLPVIDGRGHLVGVVSIDDVLQRIASETKLIGELVERESPKTAAE